MNSPFSSFSADFLTGILAELQAAILAELTQSEAENRAEAAEFQKMQSEQLTTELDARLRKHRPRAGRVEEDLRSKRWVGEIDRRRVHFLNIRRTVGL